MQKSKKFINPLTKPTTDSVEADTFTETSTDTFTETSTYTYTNTETYNENNGIKKKQKFEEKNERLTVWVSKPLKLAFEKLSKEEAVSKNALINEAIADLLKKYGQDS